MYTNCHTGPVWSEPGWNLQTGGEVCIDDFEADRASDRRFRTTSLNGLWTHMQRGVYHDGSFTTSLDVVTTMTRVSTWAFRLKDNSALVEYLKSLPSGEEAAHRYGNHWQWRRTPAHAGGPPPAVSKQKQAANAVAAGQLLVEKTATSAQQTTHP
jgi:hypothetical protein